jgi:hypothetical protein
MRRLHEQVLASKKKLACAVRASGTSLTGIFGVGPVVGDARMWDRCAG